MPSPTDCTAPAWQAPSTAPDGLPPGLQLAQALELLERADHVWPADAAPGSPSWMQSLVDGLCQLSSKDPLTGLMNRRQFEAVLEQELDRSARAGDAGMLLLLDIDHFKRVNDEYGHPVGDLVIRKVADTLAHQVRPMDTVARIGGEEFAAILPSCAASSGFAVAERVRKTIENLRIEIAPGHFIQVTVSLGGAFVQQWVRSTRTLWMERADQQLYRAKHSGRNQTCVETPPQSEVSAEERGLLLSTVSAFMPDEPSASS
jgi:diguanylate cyclase (GGDEF)-like protein